MKKEYRIICLYPSDVWAVQEHIDLNDWIGWMEVHRCEGKGEQGFAEAQQWLKDNEERVRR